jgi:2-keto-3-deoxy-L-rhamnonate aldolase RhmA
MSTKEVGSNEGAGSKSVAYPDMKFEVVLIPVTDVDRAKEQVNSIAFSPLGERCPGIAEP